jgi:predicted short-subunit dehydrogenase-like oxidoreductase (DUF2520 family)
MTDKLSIVIIGTGNVGTQLGKSLLRAGFAVTQVAGRNSARAMELAQMLGSSFSTDIDNLVRADMYLIATNDDSVETVAKSLPEDSFAVHTSGTLPLDILSGLKRYGVLYPVQTISKYGDISPDKVPLCIEGSDPETLQILTLVAERLSGKVVAMDSGHRRILHLAAVFANNFTHFLLAVSADILKKGNLSFDLLRPLIEETFRKALAEKADLGKLQTGPARRGDIKTLKSHLEFLKEQTPAYAELYSLISRLIMEEYFEAGPPEE